MAFFLKLLLTAIVFVIFTNAHAQVGDSPCAGAQSFHVVVLGSSTAAGSGPSSPDSTWVNRYRRHLQAVNPANLVTNLAVGGYTTYKIMPTGYTPPMGRPTPDTLRNITWALSLSPDAVIINMPSNDVSSGFSVSEQLHNYDTIIGIATAANIPVWIATTQPKNFVSQININKQIEVRDSILATYGSKAIDFWTTIATPAGTIDPLYDSGDGTHLNNAGHRILFQRVQAEYIPDSLYAAPNFVDYAALDFHPALLTECGDSGSMFYFHFANLGQTAGAAAMLNVTITQIDSGSTANYSLTLPPLGECMADSLPISVNTWDGGSYLLSATCTYPGDLLPSNDSAVLSFHTVGHPVLNPQQQVMCDSGPVNFTLNHLQGDSIRWYEQLMGGNVVSTGPVYTFPWLTSDTSMYAQIIRGPFHFQNDLMTTLSSNVNWNGGMVDLIAAIPLTTDSIGLKIRSLGNQTVHVYTKIGTHIGFQTNAGAWTLSGTYAVNVTSDVSFTYIPVNHISMAAGDTLGVYFALQNTGSTLGYQSGVSLQSRSNSEMSIVTGSGVSAGFAATFSPRDINCDVHYHYGNKPDGTCQSSRAEMRVQISNQQVHLPADTIIDFNAQLVLSADPGFQQYNWSTGSTSQTETLSGSQLGNGIHIITIHATDSLGCVSGDTIIVGVAFLLGDQASVVPGPFLYPNPAQSSLFVGGLPSEGKLNYRIVDAKGNTVRKFSQYMSSESIQIDLVGLSEGVYLFEWQTEETRHVLKFAVQR